MLSPHFTLAEYERTGTGLPNRLPDGLRSAAVALHVRVLEPWRRIMGYHGQEVRVKVDSGYRSEAVNAAVGGARNSQHKRAQAADCIPLGRSALDAFADLAGLSPWAPLGQGILYVRDRFIHVSIDLPPNFDPAMREDEQEPAPEGWAPRRQLLVCVDPARKKPLVPWAEWAASNGVAVPA